MDKNIGAEECLAMICGRGISLRQAWQTSRSRTIDLSLVRKVGVWDEGGQVVSEDKARVLIPCPHVGWCMCWVD